MSKVNERRKQVLEYTEAQVQSELKDLRLKLLKLRMQKQRGKVKNNRMFTQTRKDIARLMHRLTQLENEE